MDSRILGYPRNRSFAATHFEAGVAIAPSDPGPPAAPKVRLGPTFWGAQVARFMRGPPQSKFLGFERNSEMLSAHLRDTRGTPPGGQDGPGRLLARGKPPGVSFWVSQGIVFKF